MVVNGVDIDELRAAVELEDYVSSETLLGIIDELLQYKRDAERYRWLRSPTSILEGVTPDRAGNILDEEIDRAMLNAVPEG